MDSAHFESAKKPSCCIIAMGNTNASFQLLCLLLLSGIFYLKTTYLVHCQGKELDVGCPKIERQALLEFKKGLSDPSGRLSSWVAEDCCRWLGVTCNNTTGHVIKLQLRNPFPNPLEGDGAVYELGGKINSSLLHLKELTYLDLSMNNFGGVQIPSFFGALEKLTYLNLSGASFGGAIPSTLGNLSRLIYLDLNNDFKTPTESDLKWLSDRLSSLMYLNLGGVDLSKASEYWLGVVNMLPSLVELHLDHCRLPYLPLTHPSLNLTSLLVLNLANNGLNSSIPPWLFNLTSLEHLDLNANYLQGELPDAFANLNSLQLLDLSENLYIGGRLSRNLGKLCNLQMLSLSITNISGEITDFIDNLSECNTSRMEILDLGYSKLSGNLPSSLGYLKNLRYLQLWWSSLQGSIPESIGNLTSLEAFILSGNEMRGVIPESLGQLSMLAVLDLSQNEWEGTVTEAHFANLSGLKELSFFKRSPNISLFFDMSPQWIPPFRLSYLNIRSCQLGPKFPAWLRNQTELTTMILDNARISDRVPDWFWRLTLPVDELVVSNNQLRGRVPNSSTFHSATVVDLRSNRFEGPVPLWSPNVTKVYLGDNLFSGPIPDDIGVRMPFLTDLDISRNILDGSIPLSIGNLNLLSTLAISNNNLSGEIPHFWSNMSFLYFLDVSNNSLSGPIPESIGFLEVLRFLFLNNNILSGQVPSSLRNCSLLQGIDMGENRLSGHLPAWIGDSLPSLLILRLRTNFFSGNIPPEICHLSALHILDLSHNNLSGAIPPCVGDLTGLKTELKEDTVRYEGRLRVVAKGRVIEYQSTLYLVNSLDLSDNFLSGEIPTEITELVKLGTLNLSINHLSGNIPLQIGKLDWLETLDLSRNNISGTIPPSMTQLRFLNHLDLSHNNLSGRIPTTNQFQTLNDPSIYEDNPGLCGQPLPKECSNGNETSPFPDEKDGDETDEDDHLDKVWLFLSIALGFIVGFWGVCGTLIIKRSWRHAYFSFVEEKKEALLAFVSVKAARLLRKFTRSTRSQRM